MKRITRKDARRRGLKCFYTGKPCERGHVAERFVSGGGCVQCRRAANRAWRLTNPEKQRASDRAWRATNAEHVRARGRAWYVAHPDRFRAWRRAWNAAHPDRRAAIYGLALAKTRAPGCVPTDVDPRVILDTTEPFYAEARRRTLETGVEHEVDHIKALALGGLHTASNLQVMTAVANRKKSKVEQAEAKRRRKQSNTKSKRRTV